MSIKYYKVLIVIISVLLLLAACGSGNQESGSGKDSEKKEKPLVVNIANMNLSVLNVAKEAGYLDEELGKHNASFEWSQHPNGPPINEGIASKRIDLAVLGEGAIVASANNGLDSILISLSSDGLVGVNSIIAHKDSGIEKIEDIKGKKVGVAIGTSHHVFLLKILDEAGLSIKDIEIINLSVTDAHPAFQTGQLDAWVTADIYVNIEAANGARLITNAKEHQIYSPTFYVARGDFAKQNPEIVEAYLTAINRTKQLAENDNEKFIEYAAKAANQEIQFVRALEIGIYHNDVPSNELVEQFQQSVNILKDLKYVDKDIDIKAIIDTSYLEKVLAQ